MPGGRGSKQGTFNFNTIDLFYYEHVEGYELKNVLAPLLVSYFVRGHCVNIGRQIW